ncbi:MAG: DNA mismatch repair endonuclease MutL [Candidatus Magnetominusculus sp. LBB02]|nr:DNA mismatch repair endonuclease MutL [Candidatus Magnetominusculus sp. LBB02]
MPVIKLLDSTLIDKIAAGEVIERPASVVKELIENSIDAASTSIKIDILDGGKHMIRITDDGVGMSPDDALVAVKRHATSKISKESDLSNLTTLGFRGEALSSISSVSRMTCTTAPSGSSSGTSVEIHGGTVKSVRAAAAIGTIIEARELFYNTPARKKFLKGTQSELSFILDTITNAALSSIGVKFTVTVDEREVMALPSAATIEERIQQIYGREFTDGLLPFKRQSPELSIEGFSSKEGFYRRSRSHQYMFINHRPIKDITIRSAVYQAYKTLLRDGQHPIFFLYIGIDPAEVDFNVHPTKKEVRFVDRNAVFRATIAAIGKSLVKTTEPSAVSNEATPSLSIPPRPVNADALFADNPMAAASSNQTPNAAPALAFTHARAFLYLGDVYAAYSYSDGLAIIDHHAAHERVLYERLKDSHSLMSGRLLFPYNVTLPTRDYALLCGNLGLLNGMGIEIEDFGKDMFIIRALPEELLGADMAAILSDIASSLVDVTVEQPVDVIKDLMAKRLACHSSVRGKAVLSDAQLSQLIDDLNAARDPGHCPHGRPTQIYFSIDSLRKMFKRT